MKLKQLLDDDRGVSPVIGVILMVAITVILAAVIGTFVLGLGGQVGNNAPSATFNYEYSGVNTFSDNTSESDAQVAITHQTGDAIEASTLTVSVGDNTLEDVTASDDAGNFTSVDGWPETVNAGSTLTLNESSGNQISTGEDVQVVWQSEGGSSSIISTSTTPE